MSDDNPGWKHVNWSKDGRCFGYTPMDIGSHKSWDHSPIMNVSSEGTECGGEMGQNVNLLYFFSLLIFCFLDRSKTHVPHPDLGVTD